MRTIVIGDIHACYDELMGILDKTSPGAEDRIIALGDIVDRGPDNVGILEFFSKSENASTIMGNHEKKHIRSFRGEIKSALSQQITRYEIGEERYPNFIDFISSFPLYKELPEAILVHGYMTPGVPISQQEEDILLGKMGGEKKLHELGGPWYEFYDGEKPLIVGHRNYNNSPEPIIINDHVYCIDTGCCRGGALTAVILPSFEIVTVKSRTNYWMHKKEEFEYLRIVNKPINSLTWKELRRQLRVLRKRATHSREYDDKIQELEHLLENADNAIRMIHEHIEARCEIALEKIRSEHDWDNLSSSSQGSIFQQSYAHDPLIKLLHKQRKNQLHTDDIKSQFNIPFQAIAFAEENELL